MVNSDVTVLYESKEEKIISNRYISYRAQWRLNPENSIVVDFPLFLDIEATSHCNLQCPHCQQSHSKFKKGFMNWDMYKKIIDEAADNGCYGCKFNTLGRGEPLLHKELPRMIEYARERGLIDVYLNTNGVLLDHTMSERLLDAGLTRISISVDGHDRESYEKNRPGSNWELVHSNIHRFFELRDKLLFHTDIRIQTVALPNVNLELFAKEFSDIADDIIAIDYMAMNGRLYNLKSNFKCPQLWQRMAITYNGLIMPCNHDERGMAFQGKIGSTTIKEAWNSDHINWMRQMHRLGRADQILSCDGCFLLASQQRKGAVK